MLVAQLHRLRFVISFVREASARTVVPVIGKSCYSSTAMQRHLLYDKTVVLAIRRAEFLHVGNVLRLAPKNKRQFLAERRRHKAEQEEVANFAYNEQSVDNAS